MCNLKTAAGDVAGKGMGGVNNGCYLMRLKIVPKAVRSAKPTVTRLNGQFDRLPCHTRKAGNGPDALRCAILRDLACLASAGQN